MEPTKPINMQDVWREDIGKMFTIQPQKLTNITPDGVDLDAITPVSPYHSIRLATHGKTAPFINMPLTTSRVYVERVK